MAGSTALMSSILAAVLRYLGESHSRYYFAELNREIELRYMKTYCGYQDAYMTTFGGLKISSVFAVRNITVIWKSDTISEF